MYLTEALLRVAREVEDELQRLLQLQFFNFQFIEVVKLVSCLFVCLFVLFVCLFGLLVCLFVFLFVLFYLRS